MTKDIVVKEAPAELIKHAIEKGANLDQLEKLLTIQERYEANQARKEYHQAMTDFKANAPKIIKDKAVSFGAGKAAYKHASLYQVTQKVTEEMSKYGLSASWRVAQNGTISVTTRVTHVLGHFEETTLSAPSDTSGSKNAIQAIGSTISYLERYGLLAICGLATADMDDDGNSVVTDFITDKELHQLRDHLISQDLGEEKVCAFLKVESLDKLPKADFDKAMRLKKAVKK